MKKLLSKKEKARRQSIRRSPQIKQAIRRLDPARILTLDLETTGLTADAEIIQLSIMNGCGDVLMNRYFKPLYTERWDEAMEVNHITPEQVACEDPFILWADTVSSLFMDADLIVGYSTFNDIAKLHASGVVLPDKDIYLDLAEAFSLIHYQETKTITYEKLMNCAAHYGYHGRNWHDSLTDEISRAWSGMTTGQYKRLKGLTKENLRDNMTDLELVLTMLAEASTTDISKTAKPQTFEENKQVAKRGGKVAGIARQALEAETGKPVITEKNAVDFQQLVTDVVEDAAELPEKKK